MICVQQPCSSYYLQLMTIFVFSFPNPFFTHFAPSLSPFCLTILARNVMTKLNRNVDIGHYPCFVPYIDSMFAIGFYIWKIHVTRLEKSLLGIPGWLSGLAPDFSPGHGPGVPGSNSKSGSLHGACFSLCLSLPLSLMNK